MKLNKGGIMKKIIFIFGFLFATLGMVNAEVIFAPQWSEICPKSYLGAKQTRFDKDQNYWYERKLQFDESIAQCRNYQGEDLKECYSKVREMEGEKNKRWNTYVDAYNEQALRSEQSLRSYSNRMQLIDGVQSIIKTIKE